MKNGMGVKNSMGVKNNHEEDNSKNNNNCLAVFFGIIHFDDMNLVAQAVQDKQESNLVGLWVCVSPYFLGLTTEHTTLTK